MASERMVSEDEDGLPPTLTPKFTEETALCTPSKNNLPWGRLVACDLPEVSLQNIDLLESFTFGRLDTSSVPVTRRNCSSISLISEISKIHFKINKGDDGLVYLTDTSKNGTYLNKKLVGTGKCVILRNKDEIAVTNASKTVYIFFSLSQDEHDFLPKKLSGMYVSVRQLGRGACGEVCLVKHRETLDSFAVKKIIMGQSGVSLRHKMNHPLKIRSEISILSKLSHPCIMGLVDWFQVGNEIYIVLPYMQGGELTKRIIGKSMPEDKIKFYFYQIMSGIHYLHSEGVIHRDLKPENMLLLDDREETLLKISDFGLSKFTKESAASTMCGTLKYVAPEVINKGFRQGRVYGKRADVWSLGVILYFMVAEEFPFKGSDYSTVMKNIMEGNYNLTDGVWAHSDKRLLKSLIEKMLVLDPQFRITVYDIFQHQWLLFDHCVKHRVRQLLQEQNPSQSADSLLDPPTPKRYKFDSSSSSGSSGSLGMDISSIGGYGNGCNSSSTICCK